MTHKILISIGSNIRRTYHTRAAYQALHQHFAELQCSAVYKCQPVGFSGKSFYNWVAAAQTSLSIGAVVTLLKEIETDNGRTRSEAKYGSRTLDLDLLTYDDEIVDTPVVLPRDEILYHAFVLKPLRDLVPDDIHPETGQTYRQLWRAFDKKSQRVKMIKFAWSASA